MNTFVIVLLIIVCCLAILLISAASTYFIIQCRINYYELRVRKIMLKDSFYSSRYRMDNIADFYKRNKEKLEKHADKLSTEAPCLFSNFPLREDSAKERENKLECPSDDADIDEKPKPRYWFVYAENCEEIHDIPKGRDVKLGAYRTQWEAERLRDVLEKSGKWKNAFTYTDDCLVISETVRYELGALAELQELQSELIKTPTKDGDA